MEDFNDAMSNIESALGKKVNIIVGTYFGDGTVSQFIPLPITPQVLIVSWDGILNNGNLIYGGIVTPESPNEAVAIQENGFTAYGNGSGSGLRPFANTTGTHNYYALYWS